MGKQWAAVVDPTLPGRGFRGCSQRNSRLASNGRAPEPLRLCPGLNGASGIFESHIIQKREM
jgi:hypothetical protein